MITGPPARSNIHHLCLGLILSLQRAPDIAVTITTTFATLTLRASAIPDQSCCFRILFSSEVETCTESSCDYWSQHHWLLPVLFLVNQRVNKLCLFAGGTGLLAIPLLEELLVGLESLQELLAGLQLSLGLKKPSASLADSSSHATMHLILVASGSRLRA